MHSGQLILLAVIALLVVLAFAARSGAGGLPHLLGRLERLDRRWIFLIMGLAVLLPLIRPLGLPLRASPPVVSYYNRIEKLPPGSLVLVSGDYDPASSAELQPMMIATLDHLFRRNIKVVAMQLWPGGPPLADRALEIEARKFNKKYGTDYVNLGFKEGQIIAMVALGSSGFHTLFPVDLHGTPVSQLPLMQKVTNYSSFAAIISISAGFPGTKEWVQQVQNRFNRNLGTGTTAVSAAEYYAYLEAKQLFGMLGGMAGAAEYEKEVNLIGAATAGMDAMSVAHFFIIFAIILGNIAYLGRRGLERRREGS
jgi:hypothetical protein